MNSLLHNHFLQGLLAIIKQDYLHHTNI